MSSNILTSCLGILNSLDKNLILGCDNTILRDAMWDNERVKEVMTKIWTRRTDPSVDPNALIVLTLALKDYTFNHNTSRCCDESTHCYIWDRIELLKVKLAGSAYSESIISMIRGRSVTGYKSLLNTTSVEEMEGDDSWCAVEVETEFSNMYSLPQSFEMGAKTLPSGLAVSMLLMSLATMRKAT